VEPSPEPLSPLAHHRARAAELVAAGHGPALQANWPAGVSIHPDAPTPGASAMTAIADALTETEQAVGRWVDDTEIAAIRAKFAELPPDLRAEFLAWRAGQTWGDGWRWSRDFADAIVAVLHPLWLEGCNRKAHTAQALASVDAETADAVIRLCVRPERVDKVLADPALAMELEAEAVSDCVDAVLGGFLVLGADGALHANDLTAPKADVLRVGRELAAAHGLPAPRSAAAVAADPLIAARTWASI
jgi:hypothetical protein